MPCGREPVITIDGPAGAGKSTTAREVARRLGFKLVDTGALYRALAWALAQAGVSPEDEAGSGRPGAETVGNRSEGGDPAAAACWSNAGVTAEIRIAMLTSKLTAQNGARADALSGAGGVVLEGRTRAAWSVQAAGSGLRTPPSPSRPPAGQLARGLAADYETVKAEIAQRDRQDMEREIAPLRKPEGAVSVDSTSLSPEAVVQRILEVVEQARCCTGS
jgi:cytidylate kinase